MSPTFQAGLRGAVSDLEDRMLETVIDDRALLIQLHGVLSEIDPVRWHDEAASTLKSRLRELQGRLQQREKLKVLATSLQTGLTELDSPPTTSDVQSRWLEFKKRVQPAYESMAARFRAEKIHVPSLRPTNWARSAFHVSAGLVALAAIQVLPPWALVTAGVVWASFAWACELGRRRNPAINALLMKVFKPVAHEHEKHRINSATWYATSLLILAVLSMTFSPVIGVSGVSILAFGDPMAGLIGRRFGRIKLIHGRSLEGTLAFFVGGAAVSFAGLALFHSAIVSPLQALAVSLTAAAFGAVAELFSLRLDDNLAVPLASAAGVLLAMQIFL